MTEQYEGKCYMNYQLRFSVNYEEIHWNRDTFQDDKRIFYHKLLKKMQFTDAIIEDWYIAFQQGTPEIAAMLRQWCDNEGYNCDLWVFQKYSQKDIKNARYVPFSSGESYNWTDYDGDGVPYNFYKEKLCDTCSICDLDKIPTPFRVSKRIIEDQRDISSESNGIRILVDWAFEELRHELEPWVVWGDVEIADCGKYDDIKKRFVWIRPIHKVGAYTNSKVLQKCKKCGRPIEIRQRRSENIFEADKQSVESFKDINAPIVLVGNWFGEIYKGGACHVNNDVFINPTLLEKIKKMKLKAFYNPEYVIHAADEPYDWDPLFAK